MKELKQGLAHIYGDKLKAVYLYGSYARGDYRDGSDVIVPGIWHSISRVVMKEMQWKSSDTPLLHNIRMDGVRA